MNTDRSIAPLVAQFVPLKVETDGPDWGRWARQYPPDGNTIPMIFVIRADGTKLYGRSGSLQGDALPAFLAQHLLQAGRPFSDGEIEVIEQSLAAARSALEAADPAQAVRELAPLRKAGELGHLQSYAKAAVEADQFVAELTSRGQEACARITAALESDPDDPFATLLEYVTVKRSYAALSGLKTELAGLSRAVGKDPRYRELLRAAERLDGALELARTDRGRKRGIEALERIVEREAGSPAAERASSELARLAGEPGEAQAPPAGDATNDPPPLETWTDSSGKYKVVARLIGVENDEALLLLEDGTTLRVPLDKLSDESRRRIKQ